MKKIFLLILLMQNIYCLAQVSEGGLPFSFQQNKLKSLAPAPVFKLKSLNTTNLLQEDSIFPSPYRYSIFEETVINLKDGISMQTADKSGTIWQYAISSEEASSIQLIFKNYLIPPGAKLFLFDPDHTTIFGAFTSSNREEDQSFVLANFPGDQLIAEYYEPSNSAFEGTVIIGQIGQGYRDILSNTNEFAAPSGYIDVNCTEGNEWQDEKHAVCRITFREGNAGYLCSGAFINNARQDGTPYFLTANHCIGDTTTAKSVVTYFNYEKTSCNGEIANYKTLSGARLMTTGTKSDYTLLKFNTNPPSSYLPYFAGWNRNSTIGKNNVSIHHPEGLVKKISLDYDQGASYDEIIPWDQGSQTPASSHWKVVFDAGLTNEGSSGAPLFNNNKQIIGQLHGGSDTEEFYGKVSYSWNNNSSKFNKLFTFLDPDSTGITSLNGYAPLSNPPAAHFYSQFNNACISAPIAFYQYSSFNPTKWQWTITPNNSEFTNGTNAESANPIIKFTSSGVYSVKLKVSNGNGSDSVQLNNYITAGTQINVALIAKPGLEVCYCDFDSLILTGTGADSYTWNLNKQAVEPFILTNPKNETAIVTLNKTIPLDSTYYLAVKLTGAQGNCVDTLHQIIKVIKQLNDNVEQAIPVSLGTNGTYSNRCATIEKNEPVPAFTSCTGQNSWCDEYSDGSRILENSVWFRYESPVNGKIGIKSTGFDNEVAIYKATTYVDILTKNSLLLGANDDESESNPTPSINEVLVEAGKTYWIQVDGSGGSSEGSFYLTIMDKTTTGIGDPGVNKSFKIYPQPANNIITIRSELLGVKPMQIQIYSISGKLVYEQTLKNISGDEVLVNVSSLKSGIYIVQMNTGQEISVGKFSKL